MPLDDVELSTAELRADWVEVSVLLASTRSVPVQRLHEYGYADLGLTVTEVDRAIAVVQKRADLLGPSHPLEVLPNLAVVRRQDCQTVDLYSALTYLTPNSVPRQLYRDLGLDSMSKLLEEIAEIALANLWGPGGSAIRFGYPSTHGRPEAFDQAVRWLARKIGVSPGAGYRPPRRKDGGVDVVAWRHFADKRSGFPIALAQCTIQEATFTKTSDVDLRLWSSWLALDVDPTSILVIPGTVRREGPDWGQLTSVVTVVERLRLIELLSRAELPALDLSWVQNVSSRLVSDLSAGQT